MLETGASHAEIAEVVHQRVAGGRHQRVVIKNVFQVIDAVVEFAFVEVAFRQMAIEIGKRFLGITITVALLRACGLLICSHPQIVLRAIHEAAKTAVIGIVLSRSGDGKNGSR